MIVSHDELLLRFEEVCRLTSIYLCTGKVDDRANLVEVLDRCSKREQTWMIEGEWTGYTNSQAKIVHREYTTDETFADSVKAIGRGISYTDGTMLLLKVVDVTSVISREPTKGSYTQLIRDCAREGVRSVFALQQKTSPLCTIQESR